MARDCTSSPQSSAREITVLRGQGLGRAAGKAAGKLPPMPTLPAHGNHPATVHCKGSPSSLHISPEQRVTLGDSNLAAKAGELQAGMPWGTREEGIHPPGGKEPRTSHPCPNKNPHLGKTARSLHSALDVGEQPLLPKPPWWSHRQVVKPLHHCNAREDELQQLSGSCLGSDRDMPFPGIRSDRNLPSFLLLCSWCSQEKWLLPARLAVRSRSRAHTLLLQQQTLVVVLLITPGSGAGGRVAARAAGAGR